MNPDTQKPPRAGHVNILLGLGLLLVGVAIIGGIAYMIWDTINKNIGTSILIALFLLFFGNVIWERISSRKEQ